MPPPRTVRFAPTLTADLLVARGACAAAVTRFRAAWPDGLPLTEAAARTAARTGSWSVVDLDWAVRWLLPARARLRLALAREPVTGAVDHAAAFARLAARYGLVDRPVRRRSRLDDTKEW